MAHEPTDETTGWRLEIDRRRALAALGAFGSAALLGCESSKVVGSGSGGVSGGTGGSGAAGSGSGGGGGGSATGGATQAGGASGSAGTGGRAGSNGAGGQGGSSGGATCTEIPEETAGPYPDTKGMISDPAFHRSDIWEDRVGVGLRVALTIVDAAAGCAPVAGAQVELWHCDVDGVYSEYANSMNAGSTATTYLRGVQVSDASGKVAFRTIYPGWYSPRATHIHVRIYRGTVLQKTTQFGFPDAVNAMVYTPTSLITSLYTKGPNPTTNDTDQVFGDGAAMGTDGGGHALQIASVTGSPTNGFVATLTVAVSSSSG
jgi:protocatechuate 3,4-dioxygenase beta subunit